MRDHSMIALCLFFIGAQPPNSTPTIAEVRKAFIQNIERMKNRRVKYIRVELSGKPSKEFSPLNHPDRVEQETTLSQDGRWRHRSVWFQSGKMRSETIDSWNGLEGTYLKKEDSQGKYETTAEIKREQRSYYELFQIEMNVEQRIVDLLGIRSAIRASPTRDGLFILDPRVDDRSDIKETLTLDPARDYWVVKIDYEHRVGENVRRRQSIAREFMKTVNGWYPKRVTIEDGTRTFDYAVLSAEFPEKFSDADFVVDIPKGTHVLDMLKRGRYVEGEEAKPPPSHEPGLLDDLKRVPGEDWLFYGGFVVAVSAVVLVGLYFFARRPTKPT